MSYAKLGSETHRLHREACVAHRYRPNYGVRIACSGDQARHQDQCPFLSAVYQNPFLVVRVAPRCRLARLTHGGRATIQKDLPAQLHALTAMTRLEPTTLSPADWPTRPSTITTTQAVWQAFLLSVFEAAKISIPVM